VIVDVILDRVDEFLHVVKGTTAQPLLSRSRKQRSTKLSQDEEVVVRKNSIRLPSDRDAGTYLFGLPALGSSKNQSCEQKMLLSRPPLCNPDRPCFDFFRTQSAHWILCLS
jgi:hypothetical protein